MRRWTNLEKVAPNGGWKRRLRAWNPALDVCRTAAAAIAVLVDCVARADLAFADAASSATVVPSSKASGFGLASSDRLPGH